MKRTIAALVLAAWIAVLLSGCEGNLDFFQKIGAKLKEASENTDSTVGQTLPVVVEETVSATEAAEAVGSIESTEGESQEATQEPESTTEATTGTEAEEATQSTSGGTIVLPFVPAE